ncbi:DUF421 domain-containing protein [Paenibacillus cymbidii]|uniref:DUF421 domain-containing protein n=1 Tax=Paenibacillus cymbidii TaxID=1639034 RepID=UPI001F4149EF|nr:DUF421 domain-containing protein [Paenibacillus cymbidii]
MFAYIAVKLVTALIGLWIMTRLLGKKEISQLTAFDFVSSLMLSELVGNTIYDDDVRWIHLVFALVLWTVLSLALEKITLRLPKLSKALSGVPEIVIRDGRIDERAMKRNSLDISQLGMLLREQGVFSTREVAYAIFETNGNLSVLRKSRLEPATREELNVAAPQEELPVVLIELGDVQKRELARIGRDEAWLLGELRKLGAAGPRDVLFAEWTEQDGLYAQLR